MKKKIEPLSNPPDSGLVTELLIMPNGKILVHNLTPVFAGLLHELNPDAEQISSRLSRRSAAEADVTHYASSNHELPN